MGAKGFRREESSVWAGVGGTLCGGGEGESQSQVRSSSKQSHQQAGSFLVLSALLVPADWAGHTDPPQGAREWLRPWGSEEKDEGCRQDTTPRGLHTPHLWASCTKLTPLHLCLVFLLNHKLLNLFCAPLPTYLPYSTQSCLSGSVPKRDPSCLGVCRRGKSRPATRPAPWLLQNLAGSWMTCTHLSPAQPSSPRLRGTVGPALRSGPNPY